VIVLKTGVVVNSTFNWYWLVEGLDEHGYPRFVLSSGAQ